MDTIPFIVSKMTNAIFMEISLNIFGGWDLARSYSASSCLTRQQQPITCSFTGLRFILMFSCDLSSCTVLYTHQHYVSHLNSSYWSGINFTFLEQAWMDMKMGCLRSHWPNLDKLITWNHSNVDEWASNCYAKEPGDSFSSISWAAQVWVSNISSIFSTNRSRKNSTTRAWLPVR